MLRAALLTLLILIVVPATASAACRTAPVADVWYDSPAVQVWFDDNDGIVACVRATGVERVVPYPAEDDVHLEFEEVQGDRWLRTLTYKGEDSDTTTAENLTDDLMDLWTGKTLSEGGFLVPGGYVLGDESGVRVRYTDGRTQVLSVDPGDDFARQGRRLYWRAKGGPRTALLTFPSGTAPAKRPLPRARRMTRCTPRPGARLVVRFRRIVITRVGTSAYACFNGRTTALGQATGFRRLSAGDIAYTRPGFSASLDVATGVKHELPRASGPLAAELWALAARGPDGVLRVWGDARRPRVLSREPATEIAVDTYHAYWLNANGAPRHAYVTPLS
ncbi:hypothetical protein OJ997_35410 [Solirubrobacter phytolaccae]|uniref:Uncharacterized protein n=1 Tax=Solirubrobacter phytolaccae TaxID=1404360 RepID=A0A9X3NFJ2_9ACTN|nr:hypothetical protein [Solirubrobacter phytolaccae]MDA0185648.1 hypothetical protein [Solirubrobacter phytolaccae]